MHHNRLTAVADLIIQTAWEEVQKSGVNTIPIYPDLYGTSQLPAALKSCTKAELEAATLFLERLGVITDAE